MRLLIIAELSSRTLPRSHPHSTDVVAAAADVVAAGADHVHVVIDDEDAADTGTETAAFDQQ